MRCYIDRCETVRKSNEEVIEMAEKMIALPGFENEFESLKLKSDNLQIEIENAKAEAIAKVESEFSGRAEKINELLAQVSKVEVVEEIAEDSVEQTEQIEQPVEPTIESQQEEPAERFPD